MELKSYIKEYSGFPKPGILFRDISPLLANPVGFKEMTTQLKDAVKHLEFEYILAIDARGFIIGSALALEMGKGIILCRKKGKLPGEVASVGYDYEYASAELEIQKGLMEESSKVLIVDDVLATGNTALATYNILKQLDVDPVACLYLIELSGLGGRDFITKTTSIEQISLIKYD